MSQLITRIIPISCYRLSVKFGDANWVGAWWLPAKAQAIAIFLCLIPYSGFPKHLPGGMLIESVKDINIFEYPAKI